MGIPGIQEIGIILVFIIIVAIFGKKLVVKGIKDAKDIKDEFGKSTDDKPKNIQQEKTEENN